MANHQGQLGSPEAIERDPLVIAKAAARPCERR